MPVPHRPLMARFSEARDRSRNCHPITEQCSAVMTNPKPSRKEAILQALVEILETDPGARITTAGLAREVGVTEAALYRHFPSKRKMFEALIDFAESTVFSRCQLILQEQEDAQVRLKQLARLMLVFAERNPGLCRVLTGE